MSIGQNFGKMYKVIRLNLDNHKQDCIAQNLTCLEASLTIEECKGRKEILFRYTIEKEDVYDILKANNVMISFVYNVLPNNLFIKLLTSPEYKNEYL